MGKYKNGIYRQERHRHDRVMLSTIQAFLPVLISTKKKLYWIGFRAWDRTVLESVHGSFQFKLTHVNEVKSSSRLSVLFPGGKLVDPGMREVYHIEVKDKLKIGGRVDVMNEWFTKQSPLFKEVAKLFRAIERSAEVVESTASLDRLGQPESLRILQDILMQL